MNKDQRLLAEAYEKVLKEDSGMDFSDIQQEPEQQPQSNTSGTEWHRIVDRYIFDIANKKGYDLNKERDPNGRVYQDPDVKNLLAVKKLLISGDFKEAHRLAEKTNPQLASDINNKLPEMYGRVSDF